MYLIKSKYAPIYAFLFRTFGLLVGISAITLQLFTNNEIGKGFMANHVLAYFTIQTNILTSLVFLSLIIKTIIVWIKDKKLKLVSVNRSINLACTFYITITLTVYWTMLAPVLGVGDVPLSIANTLFLHLFTPLCAIIDCILFFRHGELKKRNCLYWLAYPVAYVISLVIIANVSDVPYYQFPMGDKKIPLHYPYPFLEPQVVGVGGMIGVIIGLIVVCLLFGYVYIIVDNAIAKHIMKRDSITLENKDN